MLTTTELLLFFAALYAMPPVGRQAHEFKRPRWKRLRARGYKPYNDPLRYK